MLGILFSLVLSAGADGGLVYVKRASREATWSASLEATGLPTLPGAWKYIGPFDNADKKGLQTVYPPEEEIDFSKTYRGKGGEVARWRDGNFADGIINDLDLFDPPTNEHAVVYLLREFSLDAPVEVPVSLGSDDSLKVFLNGTELLAYDSVRACAPDQHRLTLRLAAGRNQLLLKIGQVTGEWQFTFGTTLPIGLQTELRNRLDADFPPTGEARHYRLVRFPAVEGAHLEVGGLAFLPDGSLLIGTRRGTIWRLARPLEESFDHFALSEWASGLHEITGMRGDGDRIYVAQRPELTIVRDTDADGQADSYRTFCDGWGMTGNYHEYVFGPVHGPTGDLFIALNLAFGPMHSSAARWRGWCLRIDSTGKLFPFASGLRSPNGINASPEGDLFICDNQGEWVAACKLMEIREGDFHGHPASLRWHETATEAKPPAPVAPAVWFPYGSMSKSASEPLWDTTGGRFGPFAGQCFVGEQSQSLIMRVFLEKVAGRYQGACFHFRRGYDCGVNRLRFAADGSLFAGMTSRGWGSVGGAEEGLARLVYTGIEPFEILSVRARPDGFRLTFTRPIDPTTAGEPDAYSMSAYHYHYWSTYGSDELDRRPVRIETVRVDGDSRRVELVTGPLETGKVYEIIAAGVRSADGSTLLHPEAYYTLNRRVGSDE